MTVRRRERTEWGGGEWGREGMGRVVGRRRARGAIFSALNTPATPRGNS